MEKLLLDIKKLDCAGCGKKIEKTVRKLKGIESIKVFAQLGKVRVTYDKNLIHTNQIKQSIIQLGYPVHTTKTA